MKYILSFFAGFILLVTGCSKNANNATENKKSTVDDVEMEKSRKRIRDTYNNMQDLQDDLDKKTSR